MDKDRLIFEILMDILYCINQSPDIGYTAKKRLAEKIENLEQVITKE